MTSMTYQPTTTTATLLAALGVLSPRIGAARVARGPRVEVVDSAVVLQLPASARAALNAYDRTFRPWALNEYESWVLDAYEAELSERTVPSAVIGDFNGDGKLDVAVDGRTSISGLLLVILSNAGGYKVVELRKYRLPADMTRKPENVSGALGRNEVYLILKHPGDVEVYPFGSPRLMHLATDAFETVFEEKGRALCYYHDGHFEWVPPIGE